MIAWVEHLLYNCIGVGFNGALVVFLLVEFVALLFVSQ